MTVTSPRVSTSVDELDDADMTLKEWLTIIENLLKDAGPESRLSVDAGYNNVTFFLKRNS